MQWARGQLDDHVVGADMSRGGDLGMMIMMLCGFAAYMTHIG
ncbi:hypothetical protein LLE87_36675, partial [Paenibacillus polymyxa]|nr:hypothetical protein [Paenibacillus polymyxa]